MPRNATPSFVVTLPLRSTPADERSLAIRVNAARQIYNAVLGEGLRRLDLMRQGKAYASARKVPKGAPLSTERKTRSGEFRRLWESF